jgi:hypothetical protein
MKNEPASESRFDWYWSKSRSPSSSLFITLSSVYIFMGLSPDDSALLQLVMGDATVERKPMIKI